MLLKPLAPVFLFIAKFATSKSASSSNFKLAPSIANIFLYWLKIAFLGFGQEKRTKKENENLIHLVESDDLVHYGIIPELIGRLHIVATLNELDEKDMVRILTEPKIFSPILLLIMSFNPSKAPPQINKMKIWYT